MFDSYRIYLSTTPPGWGFGPACCLVSSSAIDVTSFAVQIPASVDPSDSSSQGYSFVTMEFNQDPNAENEPSGILYSNDFGFVGGTGKWSDYELAGYVVALIDYVPSSAYDYARQCAQKYYPDNVSSRTASAYQTTYDCIASCPGVSYPPFDSTYGSDSDGGSSESSVEVSAASLSTTSLAAAGGFTQLSFPYFCWVEVFASDNSSFFIFAIFWNVNNFIKYKRKYTYRI
jgi:hypothetical protein